MARKTKIDAAMKLPESGGFFSESGISGLRRVSGRIVEETQAAFRYPGLVRTVAEMRHNPTVGSALNVYRMLMGRVVWDVSPPPSASKSEKKRASIIKQMLGDMEHSWLDFIQSIIPYIEYGFALNEIVLRRRLFTEGSQYNDGLVAIRKLPPRSPTTIRKWVYSDTGNNLIGVEQSLIHCQSDEIAALRAVTAAGPLFIPIEKLIHIKASPVNGNPEGNSIYKNIFLAFKQLELLQDQLLVGVAKDVQGMLKIGLPPKYFSEQATKAEKDTLAAFQSITDNYNSGRQRGLLVPLAYDPESKQPLFSYELMEKKGTPSYDVEKAIKRLQLDILSALSVDILRLGSEGSGSFSLAESKTSILAMAISYRMQEIADALNSQLMPLIYDANGWDKARMAVFKPGDIEDVSLDEYSKAVQRIFSTSAIEVDRDVLNHVRRAMNMPEKDADDPVDIENLPAKLAGNSSRSGDGMAIGTTGDGTSTSTSGKDRAPANQDK